MNPSHAWVVAARKAINHVAVAEGLMTREQADAALARLEKLRD
jgi:hypothetical protein